MIKLENICFAYDDKVVFDNFCMEFAPASRTAILGRSGLGKTTLLGIITGLIKPQSGIAEGLPKAPIGMVFQENRLLPTQNILQNLIIATNADEKSALQMLADLGLAGSEKLKPQELSGGMARRVAIARALLTASDTVIMDEPLSGLDEQTHLLVAQVILAHTKAKTLIVITHNPADAQLLGCNICELGSQ